MYPKQKKPSNAGLQLRRAISTQFAGEELLEKRAIAPSAARLCWGPTVQSEQPTYILSTVSEKDP